MKNKQERDVPLWEKYTLSVDQAAVYFGIGSKKIRNLLSVYKDAEWYLRNGEQVRIKRRLFEEFLDKTQAI